MGIAEMHEQLKMFALLYTDLSFNTAVYIISVLLVIRR